MKKHDLKIPAALCAVALLLNIPRLSAQDATPSPADSVSPSPTPSASPNGSPSLDRMEQFRQKMNERLKTELKATDEEWTVILPLLEKVQTKMRDASPFRMFGMGRDRQGGGGGGGSSSPAAQPDPAARPNRNGSPETDALRAALESDSTSPTDIQAKLSALRESRKKSAAELEQARQDLVKVLTQRQEATLVMIGILD